MLLRFWKSVRYSFHKIHIQAHTGRIFFSLFKVHMQKITCRKKTHNHCALTLCITLLEFLTISFTLKRAPKTSPLTHNFCRRRIVKHSHYITIKPGHNILMCFSSANCYTQMHQQKLINSCIFSLFSSPMQLNHLYQVPSPFMFCMNYV